MLHLTLNSMAAVLALPAGLPVGARGGLPASMIGTSADAMLAGGVRILLALMLACTHAHLYSPSKIVLQKHGDCHHLQRRQSLRSHIVSLINRAAILLHICDLRRGFAAGVEAAKRRCACKKYRRSGRQGQLLILGSALDCRMLSNWS